MASLERVTGAVEILVSIISILRTEEKVDISKEQLIRDVLYKIETDDEDLLVDIETAMYVGRGDVEIYSKSQLIDMKKVRYDMLNDYGIKSDYSAGQISGKGRALLEYFNAFLSVVKWFQMFVIILFSYREYYEWDGGTIKLTNVLLLPLMLFIWETAFVI